ncbi:MAG: DUF1232 domain-containing protein [Synechococcaceae cyanobacterium SM2_3_1]|nr:DUF1232 domain-containing protein [Synechococcaceae cyanobacterium SM2_3_1]
MSDGSDEFGKEYNESSFWKKLKAYAVNAGKDVIEKALTLYYCLIDRDTPAWAKAIIVGALGYFIVPTDAIPDLMPVAGYSDDLGALASALAMVAVHIKPEHKEKAKEQLKIWFG